MEILKIKIPESKNQTVLEYFQSLSLSRERITYLFNNNLVKNKKTVLKPTDILNKGDYLYINISDFEENTFEPTEYPLEILYEDDYLLIVNKPFGTIIYPDKEGNSKTVANYLSYYYNQNNINRTVRHVHRLDRDTTGCLLYAKDFITQAKLVKMVEAKKVKRIYLAIVRGRLPKKCGAIDQPIARDRHNNNKMIIHPNGKKAVTKYIVHKYNQDNNQSFVEIELETGRTHQIRVHFASFGHALIGDKIYGSDKDGQLKLCSWKISFVHPITLEKIEVKAEPNFKFN